MKTSSFSILFSFLILPIFAWAEKNSMIVNGIPWYDQRDSIVSAHGGNIIRDNGKYYLFGEFKTDSINDFKGFSCYSSTDLVNWNFERIVLDQQSDGMLGKGRIGERPKVLRCPSTGEYVMIFHSDDRRYKNPCTTYATSKTINGEYIFQGPLLYKGKPLKRWDIGTFTDNDGKAYLLVHHGDIYRFADDYHSLDSCLCSKVEGVGESPAMLRHKGKYYWFSSNTTSWERNDNMYVSSESLSGPWEKNGLFAPKGSNTWNSQTSFILPNINGKDTTFMFMGDRWSFPKQRSAATYVWLPMEWDNGKPCLSEYWESWDPEKMEQKRLPLQKIDSTIWTGIKPGDYTIYDIQLPQNGKIYLKGQTSDISAYADIVITDYDGNRIIDTSIDFYSLTTAEGLRYISPRLEKGNYKVAVKVSDIKPNWSDKKRSDYGSKGYQVLITEVGILYYDTNNSHKPINTPVMGWSSWNTYHVNISDSLIKSQADAMVNLGLKDVGYNYINIDDGFFGGRDVETGKLIVHPIRFPNGLKSVTDHIHNLGLKAGIYSDGGKNTCGNFYDNDSIAMGVGFYGHDQQDADFYFNECNFDFIKIDFCGGDPKGNHDHLDLDEKERYTAIRKAIDKTGRKDVRINICRWDYPGTWVRNVGDSWRISHDIRPRWTSVKDIIDQNLYLSAYAGNGHYNDMDMLEVGRGMSTEEDKTHFGLWCIMSSPLLIGCDLNKIRQETLSLLKNDELISLNQDTLGLQAYIAKNDNGVYLLVKDIEKKYGTKRAVAIYNSTDENRSFKFDFCDVDLYGDIKVRNLFEKSDLPTQSKSISIDIPPHSTSIFRLEADKRLMRKVYEAETAYLSRYQEIENNLVVHSALYEKNDSCSGGVGVSHLGMHPDNDLQWRDVYVFDEGSYNCSIKIVGEIETPFIVSVNGKNIRHIKNTADLKFIVKLEKGNNIIRINTDQPGWLPLIDYMKIE